MAPCLILSRRLSRVLPLVLGSSFCQKPAQVPAQFPCSLLSSFPSQRCGQGLGSRHRSSFSLWFSVCPGAVASSRSFGCGLPQGMESFLSPAHAALLAREAAEPERSEVEQSWEPGVTPGPAPHLASPLRHPPSNGHRTHFGERAWLQTRAAAA